MILQESQQRFSWLRTDRVLQPFNPAR